MIMQKRLSVINTSPSSNSINVKNDTAITIYFDRDVSKNSLQGNVYVLNSRGDKLDCVVSYANRVITATPRVPLAPSDTYRVVVRGNNNPDTESVYKGVTSPIGEYMLGDYTFSFSTESANKETEFVIDMSPNNIIIENQPQLKGSVTSDTVNTPRYVDVEVSISNTFEKSLLVWSGKCSIEDFKAGISCDSFLEDGTYYWRARAVGDASGNWSETCQFAIERYASAKVVSEDHSETDIAFPESWEMMDAKIIGVYPTDSRSSVPTNLKTISIVFDQIIPTEELRFANFGITGEAVDGDSYSESHGEIDANINIAYDHENNYTILIITLPVLESEVGE